MSRPRLPLLLLLNCRGFSSYKFHVPDESFLPQSISPKLSMAPVAKYLSTLALALTASALITPHLPRDVNHLREKSQNNLPIVARHPDWDDDTDDTDDSDGSDSSGDLGYMNGTQYGQGTWFLRPSLTPRPDFVPKEHSSTLASELVVSLMTTATTLLQSLSSFSTPTREYLSLLTTPPLYLCCTEATMG